jgi:2-dehydro-3-deoxygluconokinase
MMGKPVVCFGEMMLRLNPPGYERIVQADTFVVSYAGAEGTVAINLACLGMAASFVSVIPDNPVGQAAINFMRRYGVDTRPVVRGGARLGTYFVEKGASQRGGQVIYDRAHSAVADADPGVYDWDAILDGAAYLYWTGITPAISRNAARACQDAMDAAAAKGVAVACDLNYRAGLWGREQARATMTPLMRGVSICLANDGSAKDVFDIGPRNSIAQLGHYDRDDDVDVAVQLAERFGFDTVAMTSRGSISASKNTWSGMLYEGGTAYFAPTYDLDIVDRVGGGDGFASGLLYAVENGLDPQGAVDFAVASSALKHSLELDANLVTAAEVESLAGGNTSGQVRR